MSVEVFPLLQHGVAVRARHQTVHLPHVSLHGKDPREGVLAHRTCHRLPLVDIHVELEPRVGQVGLVADVADKRQSSPVAGGHVRPQLARVGEGQVALHTGEFLFRRSEVLRRGVSTTREPHLRLRRHRAGVQVYVIDGLQMSAVQVIHVSSSTTHVTHVI